MIDRAPVAQSVSARYLYSSTKAKQCRGCEFEPHLEHTAFWEGKRAFLGLGRAPEEERKKFTEKLCSRGDSVGPHACTLPGRAAVGVWCAGEVGHASLCKVAGGGHASTQRECWHGASYVTVCMYMFGYTCSRINVIFVCSEQLVGVE